MRTTYSKVNPGDMVQVMYGKTIEPSLVAAPKAAPKRAFWARVTTTGPDSLNGVTIPRTRIIDVELPTGEAMRMLYNAPHTAITVQDEEHPVTVKVHDVHGHTVYSAQCDEHEWATGFYASKEDAVTVARGHGKVSIPLWELAWAQCADCDVAAVGVGPGELSADAPRSGESLPRCDRHLRPVTGDTPDADGFLADAYASLPVTETPWQCMTCGERYATLAELNAHIAAYHAAVTVCRHQTNKAGKVTHWKASCADCGWSTVAAKGKAQTYAGAHVCLPTRDESIRAELKAHNLCTVCVMGAEGVVTWAHALPNGDPCPNGTVKVTERPAYVAEDGGVSTLLPEIAACVVYVPEYRGHWTGTAYLSHHTYGMQVHRYLHEVAAWCVGRDDLLPVRSGAECRWGCEYDAAPATGEVYASAVSYRVVSTATGPVVSVLTRRKPSIGSRNRRR